MANPALSWFSPRLANNGPRATSNLPHVAEDVVFSGGETSFSFAATLQVAAFPAGPVLAVAVPRQDTAIRSVVCTRGTNPGEVIVSGTCAAHAPGASTFDVYLLQVS